MARLRGLALAATIALVSMCGYVAWAWFDWFIEIGLGSRSNGVTYWYGGGFGPPSRLDRFHAWTSALVLVVSLLVSLVAFTILLRARTERDRLNAVRFASTIAFTAIVLLAAQRVTSWLMW